MPSNSPHAAWYHRQDPPGLALASLTLPWLLPHPDLRDSPGAVFIDPCVSELSLDQPLPPFLQVPPLLPQSRARDKDGDRGWWGVTLRTAGR